MKKITGLLAILLVGIITITACGGKKSEPKKTSSDAKSKVSKTDSAKATTSTTITRKDQTGKVVDVQRSQTSVDTPKPTENKPAMTEKKVADQQISDPFN